MELKNMSSVELKELIIDAIGILNDKVSTLKYTFSDGLVLDIPIHHHLTLVQVSKEECFEKCSEQNYKHIETGILARSH